MKNNSHYSITFLEWSIEDIDAAEKWYEDKQAGLGYSFTQAVLLALETLKSDTIYYASGYHELSRIILKRFPYTIFFRKDTEHKLINVFGVLHNKQKRSRLDERL